MIVYATKTQWCNPAYTWNLIFHGLIITAWKVPKYGVVSGLYFPIFGLNRERYGVFSPNTGKYGPEITPQGYDQKRKLFRTNSFALAHSSAKKVYTERLKVFNTMVSHDFNMTSFNPCCHNWLACICSCACICLLPRIFCLACYRLFVEQWLAFHWDIGDIV